MPDASVHPHAAPCGADRTLPPPVAPEGDTRFRTRATDPEAPLPPPPHGANIPAGWAPLGTPTRAA